MIYSSVITFTRSTFTDIDLGDSSPDQVYNISNNDIIQDGNSDAWSEGMAQAMLDESPSVTSPNTYDYSGGSTRAPPATLVYTCGGTAPHPSYCEFPFTTLAGNSYTQSCADKVEDNPDYTVDRPWCFTSATEWGFCDCSGQIVSLKYVTIPNAHNATLKDIEVQVTMDYPGTVWCSLSASADKLPTLASILNNTNIGGVGMVSTDMIVQNVETQIVFSATAAMMKSHPYLACQGHMPGMETQPSPVGLILGSGSSVNNGDDSDEPPLILTYTSGAMMYSVVIIMVLGFFVGYKYAMDSRVQVINKARRAYEESLAGPIKME